MLLKSSTQLLEARDLCALLAENVTNAALHTVVELAGLLRGVAGTKAAEDHEHRGNDTSEDKQLAGSGALLTELGPLHATSANSLLQLLTTKLVVDKTTERDAVAKSLEKSDRVAEQEHRCENEEDILEDTGQSEDKGRSFANLCFLLAMYRPGMDVKHTRKTTETLRRKATPALANKVRPPTRLMSLMVSWGSSVKIRTIVFMTAQAGA
jgi:hypothetical protein